jgi:hypothetical protein
MRERSIASVPKAALVLLALATGLQIAWHALVPSRQAKAQDLEPPPTIATLQIASMGEPIALGKLLMFYIQAFDNQPGMAVPFQTQDYNRLEQWLSRISELDPSAQYPLLIASHLYAEVSDEKKKRQMLEFVYRRFLDDPNKHWKSLAHVTLIAKHQLKDLPLALRYAKAIRELATGKNVPNWAKQLEIFVLEDMNELESATILIGGLLETGQITDPHELRFLDARLKEMKTRAAAK